jgi:hypothetical protein
MGKVYDMNQILSFYNIGNSKEAMKKAIKVFCISIVLFAIILIVEGFLGYNEFKNRKISIDTPEINIVRDNGITKLNIYSIIGIQKVVYSWSDGLETVVNKTGENEVSVDIDTAIGTNDLNIKIIDSDGNTIVYDPIKIAYEGNEENSNNIANSTDDTNNSNEVVDWQTAVASDTTNPKIELSSSKGKIVIKASDDVKMSYVTYAWNDEDETTITGLSEDEMSLTAEIDAKKGDNVLKVKAYDKAGNVEELEKEVHGTDGPNIDVKKENDQIVVKVTDEYGITKIKYNFNGEEKTIDNISQNEYELKLDLKDGENYIIVEAYENSVKSEYKGKTTK